MANLPLDFSDDIRPLAARLRPLVLSEYVGQQHLIGPGTPLYQAILAGKVYSLILWGPPGTGKTTLAELIASHAKATLQKLSAVTSGVKDIRQAISDAQQRQQQYQQRTLLFVDEVHRFNKAQQDAFLPFIEDGTIIFIGATTENPAFALNNAILSRARVCVLKALNDTDLQQVLQRALTDQKLGLGAMQLTIESDAEQLLLQLANGDARKLLNILEQAADLTLAGDETGPGRIINAAVIKQVVPRQLPGFDNQGDMFYDLISAFHKSVRGSDPDAALYWYCRILAGGGDPLYVARRLLAIASEDIGNADPRALTLALNAWDTFSRVGPAEGERAIAQATVYLALAPKSNAVYQAFNQMKQLAETLPDYPVPLHLRNAPSKLQKQLGHGEGYRYAHNEPGAYAAGECYLPPELDDKRVYQPTERGMEKQLADKLAYLRQLDRQSPQQRHKK
ncbi:MULTISPECIES: replication-associated recombination protein A [unclassified Arsukibacterium]|uniref:replication-associated recombination protein A n=1 Tax=unclassified Arsukibacterium TaxID=2635278 RepID=UPI000C5A2C76|nr:MULTISPECIES: replication-associated recombination protein A [unclassified Arsukibacterium]MAA95993.1 recombination factor protein RarA [Rheinheimera sp.]MBM33430.1 recombination factor protein RarA [Rheinheimera sp.]HAW91837.1 recombination factor protein RarA [Candidatus Azambacteria bacterium]|tara:strand:- start:7662 stop:9014 length:1353 start_codon:yes stop_codon:yes gene_type:complete